MTLEECIAECERLARVAEPLKQTEVYKYNKQVAEWLRELRNYRALFRRIGRVLYEYGYTIDDLDTIFGKVNREVNADDNT